ncbi:LacI family DNA-binding transcriptional regulator [Bauldia sp.]|uniref:LacI family DNA-binding transcriptional regulator n=1 Tax=Bauldia sp. TaxID=2575872 RepID=UPI003BACF300
MSITQVAQTAGVSVATVSRIVNGNTSKASPETVERVRQTVRDLGYRPISAGRALRNRQSHLVGVLAANVANPSMAAIAASTEAALRRHGLTMVLCDTHDRADLQDEYLMEMRVQFARAIVFLGVVDSPKLDEFRNGAIPLLFVNRRPPKGKASFVGIDNRQAGRDVADHLLTRGISDIAVIHGSLASSATEERVAAFRQATKAAGHPLPRGRVMAGAEADHLAIGADAMRKLLERGRPPRGIFCLSDLIAYGAHRVCREAGLSVPGDVDIIGFDDNPLNEWIAPWLTSVRVPYDAYGDAVADTLNAMAEGADGPSVLLDHQLIVRDDA